MVRCLEVGVEIFFFAFVCRDVFEVEFADNDDDDNDDDDDGKVGKSMSGKTTRGHIVSFLFGRSSNSAILNSASPLPWRTA